MAAKSKLTGSECPDGKTDRDAPDNMAVVTDPIEVSRFIAQISAELAAMARGSKLDVLAYFLEMAHLEAVSEEEQHGRR